MEISYPKIFNELSIDKKEVEEISVTCHGFQNAETTIFFAGTEKGDIHQINRFDRASAYFYINFSKAGLDPNIVYQGHQGSITSMDFHPSKTFTDFQNLYLTSSFDWTVKLWKSQQYKGKTTVKPLKSFEAAQDFVADVKWCPSHPASFASVDAAGNLDLYNLVITDAPISTYHSPNERGYNKLAWDKNGTKIAAGSLDGEIHVYEVGHVLFY